MPTLTIDLELPEAEYRFAAALTQAERRRVASIALTAAFATARNVPPTDEDETEDESWKNALFTQEEIDALASAIAQQDAGEVYDGDVFFEKLYKEKGWILKP